MRGVTSVRDHAAAWYERLHRDKVTEETRHAFAAWVGQKPEHKSAYDAVEGVWQQLRGAAEHSSILALRHETALRLTRRTSRGLGPVRWAAAAVVLLTVGAFLFRAGTDSAALAWLSAAITGHSQGHYMTATGERLNISLEDGSQVTLNTQTELQVRLDGAQRYVRLIRGQALFEVAHDPRRPFVVEANSRRFTAIGTAFDVRLGSDRVELTMIEGTVRVERVASAAPVEVEPAKQSNDRKPAKPIPEKETTVDTPRFVTAGEQLRIGAEGGDRVQPTDAERITSWRRGQVMFDNTRLIDAIAEINRYSTIQLQLDNPALENLRLSGTFSTSRPRLFVEALTSYFPLQIETADEHVIVLGSTSSKK